MSDTVRIEQITPRGDCVEVEYGLLDEAGIYVSYTIIVRASDQQYTADQLIRQAHEQLQNRLRQIAQDVPLLSLAPR